MKKGFILMLLALTLCFVVGCEQQEKRPSGKAYDIYYLSLDGMSLETVPFYSENKITEDLVNELLTQLETIPSDGEHVTAKPENVHIIGVEVLEDQLVVSFDAAYSELVGVKDVLCRAAYVSTLTQIAGIDFVKFEVEGAPLADALGNKVGAMKGQDFVSDLSSELNLYQSQDVTLYYASLDGQQLIPVKTELSYSLDSSYEKMIIERLIVGPSKEVMGGYATLPEGTKLVSVYTDERICYVSFNEKFLEPMEDVSKKTTLYSVVNSLCSLPKVDSVQLSINGESHYSFTDVLTLDKPYTADKSLVNAK